MAILKKTKGLEAKRIKDIENFELSLMALCNPNCKGLDLSNPIALEANLAILKEVKDELDAVTVDMKKINCNRIYTTGADTTETEKLIKMAGDGTFYLQRRKDYLKMMEQKELDKVFPLEERRARVTELEQEIKREVMKGATIGRLSKELRSASEERAEVLRKELNTLLDTLEVIDEEYLNSMLYHIAFRKIEEIKERINYKIKYLNGVLA